MASNRIYLKCKICGKTLFLGKRFLEGYYLDNYRNKESLEERLNEFYAEHYECSFDNDTYGQDCFELEYETPPKEKRNESNA